MSNGSTDSGTLLGSALEALVQGRGHRLMTFNTGITLFRISKQLLVTIWLPGSFFLERENGSFNMTTVNHTAILVQSKKILNFVYISFILFNKYHPPERTPCYVNRMNS
jgi:hypothetical protein